MNKGEMKRLGDYIREVDVRNRDLEVTKLLGVSISKEFMPSIANTIGTDMSSYKIVEPRQFAYGPVTSRNGDKVSIALYKDDEKAIVSQAYTIFEVKNKQELLPVPIYGGNGIVGYTKTSNAENVIVIGRVGINCGNALLEPNKCWVNDNAMMAIPKSDNIYILYWLIKSLDLNGQSEGSGQPLLTQAILTQQDCLIPSFCIIKTFDRQAKNLAMNAFIRQSEIVKLNKLQSLLLAKLGQ